jgi:hypothetical protein
VPGLSDTASLIPSGVEVAPGWTAPLAIPTPAAGATVAARKVPGETWERVLVARATLTTDATVGLRLPRFEVLDQGGATIYGQTLSGGIGPSSTAVVSVAKDGATGRPYVPGGATNAPGNPAPGAEVALTVPAGVSAALDAVTFKLVTSATVATRTPTLIIDDGVNVMWQLQAAAGQAAGSTVIYQYGGNSELALRNGVLTEPLPPLILGPGYRIRTVTAGIQVGDQYSAIVASYGQSPSGDAAAPTRWPDLLLRPDYTMRFVHDGIGALDSWSAITLFLVRYPSDIAQAGFSG